MDSYQALYRKWRPKVFEDVIGQEHITQTLRNELMQGKTAHAYLFTGSRGTGKTTCSKILAKAVNCLNPQNGDPCCECEICRGIEEGSILDVVEIDAASNNGVDNIRDLREEANFMPASAKYRVYIIDETHMLSIGAFKAQLKIMEEPPSHVLFILATTEVHKVPATILSRCQRFDFKRIESEKIANRILYIAKEENVSITEDAALLIARLSDGGMRDALSLTDVCISNSNGGEITAEVVSAAAGLAGNTYLYEISQGVLDNNVGKVLDNINRLSGMSVEFERLCEQLISHYRNLMIAKTVHSPEDLIIVLPSELEQIKQQAKSYGIESILFCLDMLSQAMAKMARGSSKRMELEMALVKMCTPSLDNGEAAILARLQAVEDKLRTGNFAVPMAGQRIPEQKANAETTALPDATEVQPHEMREVVPLDCWPEVLDWLSRKNPALHGTLSGAAVYVTGDLALIDAPPDSNFRDLVRKSDVAKQSLREALYAITGKKYRLGPYLNEKYKVAEKDPLDELINQAESEGVHIEIKDNE